MTKKDREEYMERYREKISKMTNKQFSVEWKCVTSGLRVKLTELKKPYDHLFPNPYR